MKYKSYELFGSIHFFTVIMLFFLFLLIFISIRIQVIRDYSSISSVVSSKNQVMVISTDEELSWLYRNHYLYVDGKKLKYDVDRVQKSVIKRNDMVYHQVFLSLPVSNHYEENDSVSLYIYQDSLSFLSLFFRVWKGG